MHSAETRLYLATGNAHKLAEFRAIFAAVGARAQILGADALGGLPAVNENAGTFAGNASIKARALRAIAPRDAWVFADDSGLQVDFLGGAPGVHSARYAGAHGRDADNTQKLLDALRDVPDARRGAQFACVICAIAPDGAEHFFEGVCRGRILRAPAGCGGFGYDPVFAPVGYDKSFAELSEGEKNALSHRGKAARAFAEYLAAHGL